MVKHCAKVASIVWLTCLLVACTPWGSFDNPGDPKAANYQGYDTIAEAEGIQPASSGGGTASIFMPKLVALKVAGAERYGFQVSEDSTFAIVAHENLAAVSNEYLPLGWVNPMTGVTYYWRVQAYKDGNWGAWSTSLATFSMTIPGAGATVPVSGATVSSATPNFDWDDIAGASGYRIQISTVSDFTTTLKDDQTLSASRYSQTTQFDDSVTYYWRVAARNSDGIWSAFTGTMSLSTALPAATSPTFTPPAGTYTTSTDVTLSTTTPNAKIYFTTNGDPPTKASQEYTGSAVTATITPSTTIKAIAVAPGFAQSGAVSATYVKQYFIGDAGPAGGLVFYDKGYYSNGSRYLEAAPGDQATDIRAIYAAAPCTDLISGGYSDWYLPSIDDLDQMYLNLKVAGLGNFEATLYWSSSQYDWTHAWSRDFNDGHVIKGYYSDYDSTYGLHGNARAIRAF